MLRKNNQENAAVDSGANQSSTAAEVLAPQRIEQSHHATYGGANQSSEDDLELSATQLDALLQCYDLLIELAEADDDVKGEA